MANLDSTRNSYELPEKPLSGKFGFDHTSGHCLPTIGCPLYVYFNRSLLPSFYNIILLAPGKRRRIVMYL